MANSEKLIIAGRLVEPPAGLHVTNHLDPAVPRFNAKPRGKTPVTELVIHETVTTSVATTIRVLQRRKLGVHLIIGPDGDITQHNDLAFDRLSHAPPHSKRSVGVEVVNPYYPEYLRDDHPWKTVIDARWAHKKQYVVPTIAQAEATAQLIAWLTSESAKGLRIPRNWVGQRKQFMAMGRLWNGYLPSPGILAHTNFGHADGAWLVLYAWLRLEAGLEADAAYDRAIEFATGSVRKVDLSEMLQE